MVSNHNPTVYGSDYDWAILSLLLVVGLFGAKFLFSKSASGAPSQF
jgi:uncharacterized membrane protein